LRQWIGAFNAHDAEAIGRMVTDDFVRHDPNSPEVHGPDGERQLVAMYAQAFPDLQFTIEDLVAAGDRVVVRLMARGTHQGELLGIPPTGRPVSIAAIEIYRLEGNRIAEQWVASDALGMLQQLGVVPVPGQHSAEPAAHAAGGI
jgi:steroid delta-isomerase-like uncharacterized protein